MTLSIRSKMIATSAFLVAMVVGVFAVVTNQMLGDDLEKDRARVSERRTDSMEATGRLLTQLVAQGSLALLADYQVPNLFSLANNLVAGSESAHLEIIQAVIYDTSDPVAWAPGGDGSDPPTLSASDLGMQSFRTVDSPQVIVTENSTFVIAPIGVDDLNIGYAVVEFGRAPLQAELVEINRNTTARIQDLQRNTMILGGLAILLGIIIAVAQSLRITNPILRLAGTAQRIAAGDLQTRAKVKGRDEIGKLSQSFNNMAERIEELLTETAEKATMQKELEVARIIQETLLPPSGVIEMGPLRVFGYFRSASVCGGDFWNVSDLVDGRKLIVIGDVTGHGVPSAMITASAKSSMDTVRNIRGKNLSLTYLLEEMNRTIFESAKRKFVMTFFAMAFDPSKNELTFSNAGHNFPFLVRRDQGKVGIRGLVARGNRLGDVEDSRYMEQKIAIRSGDLIALYTDGLTEYRNEADDEYGERRFRRMLEKSYNADAEEIGQGILRDLSRFANQAPQEDDVTLVIIKVGQLNQPGVRREMPPPSPN